MSIVSSYPAEHAIPTRYSLLSRLVDRGDQESWNEFFDTYRRLIHSLALRAGLHEAEAQDVLQETVISVAKNIHTFKRDRALGSFKGWLRNVVRWRIADQFRKRTPRTPGNEGDDRMEPPPLDLSEIADPADSELDRLWQEEWQKNLFQVATDRVKRRIKEEHYQIFDLYVLKDWPVTKVARSLRVGVGTVYIVKHRVLGQIKKEIALLENELI